MKHVSVLIICIIFSFIIGLIFQTKANIHPYIASLEKEYEQYKQQLKDQRAAQERDKQQHLSWKDRMTIALKVAQEYDFPPSVMIGQMALESAHGTSEFCQVRNNCFGLNAVDANPNNAFDFPTFEEGVRYYVRLIINHYPNAYQLKEDPIAMLQTIWKDGYASDPLYVSKVVHLPEFINLQHPNDSPFQ